ncbi:MAG: SDR family NAD(P)-dependent oxidoreductase [Mycobacterium sp.]
MTSGTGVVDPRSPVESSRLHGKVAIVTGGGQGIGKGVVTALVQDGAAVVIAGRTLSKCEAVAVEITAAGGNAIAIQCDVSSRDQVQAVVGRTIEAYGGLDIVVNNAQSAIQRPLIEVTDSDVQICFGSGSLATLYAMQAAYPHLVARGGGSIVNFGSSTAIDGNSTFGAYAMAKEAIRGLSRVAAREWGPAGIRVNVVVPNAMSPAAEAFRDANPERFERQLAVIPLRRMGDPHDDIGRAVAALVSDDFSYMSGQTLMLTGGA